MTNSAALEAPFKISFQITSWVEALVRGEYLATSCASSSFWGVRRHAVVKQHHHSGCFLARSYPRTEPAGFKVFLWGDRPGSLSMAAAWSSDRGRALSPAGSQAEGEPWPSEQTGAGLFPGSAVLNAGSSWYPQNRRDAGRQPQRLSFTVEVCRILTSWSLAEDVHTEQEKLLAVLLAWLLFQATSRVFLSMAVIYTFYP